MKKQFIFLSFLLLVIASGCSIMGMKKTESITGKWVGIHSEGVTVIFEFNEDNSMKFTVPGYSEYDFTARYTVDFSTEPISLDLINVTPSGTLGSSCAAIIKFSEGNKMVFNGAFGNSGNTTRPAEFDKYSFGHIEFTRSTE